MPSARQLFIVWETEQMARADSGDKTMQLPWDEHFHEIVIPAWQAYLRSETRLTEAANARNDGALKHAG